MSTDDDPAILDGLPRDFPHDLAPGEQPPEVISVLQKQQQHTSGEHPPSAGISHATALPAQHKASPAHTDQSLPSPTTTAYTETSVDGKSVADPTHADAPPPPPPEVVMKPLPEAPKPGTVQKGEPAPEGIKNPVDLVAHEHALPAKASKTASQLDDPSVKDLGWRANTVRAPSLIKGMSNDDVFQLIRRFNKVRLVPHGSARTCYRATYSKFNMFARSLLLLPASSISR